MPLYEYICNKCGHEFEEMQKPSDAPLKKCPKCRGALAKKISRTAFQLKGDGWYKDGYAKPAAKKESSASTDAKPAKSAKADSAK